MASSAMRWAAPSPKPSFACAARTSSEDGLGQGTDGMRERAATLGGTVEWRRGDLGGTEVVLTIPADALAQAA